MNGQISMFDYMAAILDITQTETMKRNVVNVQDKTEDAVESQNTALDSKAKIKDFGEKIGGARKDEWRRRGLSLEDLSEFNSAEREKYVVKNNVWKKPNYVSMREGRLSPETVYFYKTIRDSLPPGPYILGSMSEEERNQAAMNYIKVVNDIKEHTYAIKDITQQSIRSLYENMQRLGYVIVNPGSYYVDIAPQAKGIITGKVLKAMQESIYKITLDAARKRFAYSDDEQMWSEYKIMEFSGSDHEIIVPDKEEKPLIIKRNIGIGHMYAYVYPDKEAQEGMHSPDNWRDGEYYVIKGNREPVAFQFKDQTEAEQFVRKTYEQEKQNDARQKKEDAARKRKKAFIPAQLKHVEREGEDYRGGTHATGEDYLKVFSFKGGEFGNWMSESDRQASLDYAYDAFKDMAAALGIRDRDISLGGGLSIAFGSRGKGGKSAALAHFEPIRNVINLTKMKGAGALAHEWGHALDCYLAKSQGKGNYLTENRPGYGFESFKKVMNAMKYKPGSRELTAYYKDAQTFD